MNYQRVDQKVWDPRTGSFRTLPLDDCDSEVIEAQRLAVRHKLTTVELKRLLQIAAKKR